MTCPACGQRVYTVTNGAQTFAVTTLGGRVECPNGWIFGGKR